MEKKICPICGNPYTGHPALSRTNDKTEICSDCGIRQSLQSIGISPEEQEKSCRLSIGIRNIGRKSKCVF